MYQKQLISLQKSLSSLGIDFDIERVDNEVLSYFPCETTRKEIDLYGYPSEFILETTSGGGFYFFSANVIKEEQKGYEFKDKLVIAHVDCDPIVMNPDSSISWSAHGGKWEFYKIAENISQFFMILEAFSLLFFRNFDGNIDDKDFNIIEEKYNFIKNEIYKITKDEYMVDNFLKYILYQ